MELQVPNLLDTSGGCSDTDATDDLDGARRAALEEWVLACLARGGDGGEGADDESAAAAAGADAGPAEGDDFVVEAGGLEPYLRAKASTALAEFQRRRQRVNLETLADGGLAKAVNTISGLEVRRTEQYGNGVYATRPFRKFDVVLVEEPAMFAARPFDTVPDDKATPAQLHATWKAQLEAFAAAPPKLRHRILEMCSHEDPLEKNAEGMHEGEGEEVEASAMPPRVAAALRSFMTSEDAQVVDAAGEPLTEEALARVPHIFLANAVEWPGVKQAIPVVTSMVNHSCDSSLARNCGFPQPDLLELIARRDIAAGEQLTLDYLGSKLWGRERRQKVLLQSKSFRCICERCKRADWESAIVCPNCLPMRKRDGGFCLPVEEEAHAGFGYVTEEAPDSPGAQHGVPWVCNRCKMRFSRAELDCPLPEGAPAESYLGLVTYCEKMVEGIETCDTVREKDLDHISNTLRVLLGTQHYTAQVVRLKQIECKLGKDKMASHMHGLWEWIENWVLLDPTRLLGPQTVVDAVKTLVNGQDGMVNAHKYLTALAEGVPKFTPAYKLISAGLLQLREHCV